MEARRPRPRVEARRPSGGTDDQRACASLFREQAEQLFTRLPLYRRIAEGAANDLEVAGRLLLARPDQQVPNLLYASVHDLLLAGEPDPLADWYPSIAGERGDPGRRARRVGHGPDDPWPHFRRLALGHPGVEERLRTRATQTNEVGRSATLLPALFQASRANRVPPGGLRPLGLIDLGSSAGLNLGFDRYGYRYHRAVDDDHGLDGPHETIESVHSGSRLVLDCVLRGPLVPPLPDGPLPVATAVGIDAAPIAVGHAEDRRWLVACQWPEETERLAQLRAAIELARFEPPVVEEGDMVDDLARHVAAVPGHALPVVIATWALTYLPVARQRELVRLLDDLGEERDLALVFAEQPERVPGLPIPPRPDGQPDGRATALVRVGWKGGEREAVRLADQHPHGRWLEWLELPGV